MELSKRALSISPSSTLVIDAKAKKMRLEGVDVVGFGAGEPDFDTPEHIKEAAVKAIKEGFTKYTPASGMLELKEAVCRKLKKDNGLEYKLENIVISNGAKHSLANIFQAICNPGDEVIIPCPCWVSYPEMIKMASGKPIRLKATEEEGFKPSIDKFLGAITEKTKAIIINSPSNPTGMVYTEEELREIAKIAVEKKIYIISDEIYEKLIYDNLKHVSIASFNEEIKDLTILVNGVSKSYSMTGWRIGYTASNEKIADVMTNIQSHFTSNPNSIAQKAALAALDGNDDIIDAMISEFVKRRDYMVDRINSIEGISCIKPNGAFYVMMNISKLIGKEIKGVKITGSDVFANVLLEKANVALVPGSGFGTDIHVRLSYATSFENITEGLNRIEKFLNK
ncbi:MAG: pyridoxal phosphate-dependent aminotransferase [Clostridium sp.]|jgi:aspartate aminotransferase|nr:pyridoxal phosphate-dependent aminotransferase [Clostridium sp.]